MDNRKGNAHRKTFNDSDQQKIKDHINSFPRDESHYGRAKSCKEYLSPDLNVSRMYNSYKALYPQTSVSYKFYMSVFKKYFPHVSFHRPRTDTCKQCDMLHFQVQSNNEYSPNAKVQQQLHHKKYKRAMELMSVDSADSKLPNNEYTVLSIDMQQVLPVPTLTHSNMFYCRQLSCYNLGIHISDDDTAHMCMWDESMASRGSSEVASCLFKIFNLGILKRKKLIIWSDNCTGQNKNSTVVLLMMFLVNLGWFQEIVHKFLVSGHSFLSCDRDFAIIEKRRRVSKALVPQDLQRIVESAKVFNPFHVVPMEASDFFNFKNVADTLLTLNKCNISKCTMLKVSQSHPSTIAIKTTYSILEQWKVVNVLKRGKSAIDIQQTLLQLKDQPRLSVEKKRDLSTMLPFLPEEHREFYETLISTPV